MKNYLIFFITLIISPLLNADATYRYRDIQAPPIQLDDNIIITQIAPQRSGSTLIYSILQYLFEDNPLGHINQRVIKSHESSFLGEEKYLDKEIIIFTTVRDPLDIQTSLHYIGFPGVTLFRYELNKLNQSNIKKIITLRYESFKHDNFEYIFNKIEHNLSITIPNEIKKNIVNYFSTQTMIELSKKFENWSYHDPYTLIHGNHINKSDWRRFFTLEQAKEIYNETYDLRIQWGYPPIDVEKEWFEYQDQINAKP